MRQLARRAGFAVRLGLLTGLLIGLMGWGQTASAASSLDALWWNGADQTGGSMVPIAPFAGGNKVDVGGDTSGSGFFSETLVITGYSRTWDASLAQIGTQKQADIFLTTSNLGAGSWGVTVRFDVDGSNVLRYVASREYNIGYGSATASEGPPRSCEPFNNCSDGRVIPGGTVIPNNISALAQESAQDSAGYVYNFSALIIGDGPGTKNSTQFATIRIGSVLFELENLYGTSEVRADLFQAGVDGVLDNASNSDPVSSTAAFVTGLGFCGDGSLDVDPGSEQCDDGNTATGDGCDDDCQVESGYMCTFTSPSVCSEVCGDGVITPSETCDDGNTATGDGCDDSCAVEDGFVCQGQPSVCGGVCGDGAITANETCDDSNATAGDGCDDSCQTESGWMCTGEPSSCSEVCGDGIITTSEGCDDGNTASLDGCSDSCQVEAGYSCTDEPSVCALGCGDGDLDPGEACDDGNATLGDGCDDTCQVEPGYACEGEPSACSEVCGDGTITTSETCDDGNTDPADGCDDSCQTESGWVCADEPSVCMEVCGNGINTASEGCDDGNAVAGDGCSDSCQVESGYLCTQDDPSVCTEDCGDGVVTPSEGCDDSGTATGDGCDDSCQVEAGYDCEGEPSSCQLRVCGDGDITSSEGCDDGNAAAGDGCDDSCQIEVGYVCTGEPSVCSVECGDGLIVGTETCDDGERVAGDGCSFVCQVEPNYVCTGEPSVCALGIDECSTADVITTFPFDIQVDTGDATAGQDDASASCGMGADGATAWYTIQTDVDSRVSVDTTGSSYDTVAVVYQGACEDLSEVECNDDEVVSMAVSYADGSPSKLEFDADAGTPYSLRVGSYNMGDGGTLALEILVPEPGRGLLVLASLLVLAELRRRRR